MHQSNTDAVSALQPYGAFLVLFATSLLLVPEAFADPIFQDRFEHRTFKDCPDCPTMVMIPAGTFTQGSPESEPQSSDIERPQRTVNLPNFALGQYSVTFDEWDACVADGGCTHNPGDQGWGRGNHPVINVSWDDAQEYVTWLSNKTGQDYRLPSESEWEYATRAGTIGRFNTGDCITTDQANFNGEFPATDCPTGIYRAQTLPVASFAPNAFGLYDTHGNVFNWVEDCWNANYNDAPINGSAWVSGDCSLAVLRGGSWGLDGYLLRSAARVGDARGTRNIASGFRVARAMEVPVLESVTANRGTVPVLGTLAITVTLDFPAPAGGVSVSVAVVGPIGTAPTPLNVLEDERSVTFDLSAAATPGSGTVEVTLDAQTLALPVEVVEFVGTLVINEVDYDQVGIDAAEFVEIFNGTSVNVDLSGYRLLLINGFDDTVYREVALEGVILGAGGFLVVTNPTLPVAEGAQVIRALPATNAIQNGAPDGIVLASATEVIDSMAYEGAMDGVDLTAQGLGIVDLKALPLELADSNTEEGSLSRVVDGVDSGDPAADWTFTATPTPGGANILN